LLWSQVVTAFGAPPEAAYLKIHAVTAVANKTLYDRRNNLLRASSEALAAVLGGCDWLTVTPFGFDERLAANVQHILREETHLDRVADAGGGSYYLETLTALLAGEAWKLFQAIEAAGAFDPSDALARARKARESAVATRRRTFIGTTTFADPNEQVLDEAAGQIEAWRMSGVFERLRLRAERHARANGAPPRVLLLEAGDAKMRKARSGFCADFFHCAGFRTFTASELADADLIVLCSSDPEYVELARRICPQTKQPTLVAGNPKDSIEALRTAGIADFVYLGANAVEMLERWQNRLGMEA
jgi:methylmalonyl-CoA mutase